jgi:hypothetical protein
LVIPVFGVAGEVLEDLDEAAGRAKEHSSDDDPFGVEVAIEEIADAEADEAAYRDGERELDDGLGAGEVAEGAAGFGVVGHVVSCRLQVADLTHYIMGRFVASLY